MTHKCNNCGIETKGKDMCPECQSEWKTYLELYELEEIESNKEL